MIQQGCFEIFKEFDLFCRIHNLRYYLLGGTMLGAIRHKGFIPWDDDIDVGMPRKDYEKMLSLSEAFEKISPMSRERLSLSLSDT